MATTRDIRGDDSSLCYFLDYVTLVSWRRVVAQSLDFNVEIKMYAISRGMSNESWLWHWTTMLRLVGMRRVMVSVGRLITFFLECNIERRAVAFWHGLATTRFFPLELVWLDLFTSFRDLKPFLQAFTLLSLPRPNKTSIPPQKSNKMHY